MKTTPIALLLIMAFAVPAHATVRNLTYCIKIYSPDRYTTTCPGAIYSPQSEITWNYSCLSEGLTAGKTVVDGVLVELWDKDNRTSDGSDPHDFIASFYADVDSEHQASCVSFGWDSEARGEEYPDLFVNVVSEVSQAPGLTTSLCFDDPIDGPCRKNKISYFDTVCQDVGSWWAGSTCSQTLDISTSSTSLATKQFMVLKSLARFEAAFGSRGRASTDDIFVAWEDPRGRCPGSVPCAFSRNWMAFKSIANGVSYYQQWERPLDVVGQVYLRQLFEQDTLPGDPTNVCTGYDVQLNTAQLNDSCATIRGWGAFVALASMYKRDARKSAAFVYGRTSQFMRQETCALNSKSAGMIAAAFWNTYDIYTGPTFYGDDLISSYSLTDMVGIWDAFPNSSANYGDLEPTPDGQNLEDYFVNGLSKAQQELGSTYPWQETLLYSENTQCQSSN